MKSLIKLTLVFAPALALTSGFPGPDTLVISDKVVSHRVRMIDGESWVPVRDLATSSGMGVQVQGNQIVISAAGGANQIGTLSGKLGDTVFNGKWRLIVHSFQPVDSYHVVSHTSTDYSMTAPVSQYDPNTTTFTPRDGYKLYVADCTVKNAQTSDAQFDWSPYDTKTMVAADSGVSYSWMVFDIPSPSFDSAPLAPGSALNFKICFAVAATAKPQSLVITLKSLNEKKGQDARISLG